MGLKSLAEIVKNICTFFLSFLNSPLIFSDGDLNSGFLNKIGAKPVYIHVNNKKNCHHILGLSAFDKEYPVHKYVQKYSRLLYF